MPGQEKTGGTVAGDQGRGPKAISRGRLPASTVEDEQGSGAFSNEFFNLSLTNQRGRYPDRPAAELQSQDTGGGHGDFRNDQRDS